MSRTRQQRRAASALERTNQLRKTSADFRKAYRSYVDRLGPAIVMNGLGQALATERAAGGLEPKSDQEWAHLELYRSLQSWLCSEEEGVFPDEEDLLHAITTHDQLAYLRAQVEALAWLDWHKKFCRASFPKEGP